MRRRVPASTTTRKQIEAMQGRIEYAVPQVRGLAGWRSAVRDALTGRSEELERLEIEMWARGLSVRDIEAGFVDETGRSVLSKSAVSAVTERLWADYQAFTTRDLSEQAIVYLFVDGITRCARANRVGAQQLQLNAGVRRHMQTTPGDREGPHSLEVRVLAGEDVGLARSMLLVVSLKTRLPTVPNNLRIATCSACSVAIPSWRSSRKMPVVLLVA